MGIIKKLSIKIMFFTSTISCGNVSTTTNDTIPDYYERVDSGIVSENKEKVDSTTVTESRGWSPMYMVRDYVVEGYKRVPHFDFKGMRIELSDFDDTAFITVKMDDKLDDRWHKEWLNYHLNFKNRGRYVTYVLYERMSIILTDYFERTYDSYEDILQDIMNDKINLDEIYVREANSERWYDGYIIKETNIHKYFKDGVKKSVRNGSAFEEINYDE